MTPYSFTKASLLAHLNERVEENSNKNTTRYASDRKGFRKLFIS